MHSYPVVWYRSLQRQVLGLMNNFQPPLVFTLIFIADVIRFCDRQFDQVYSGVSHLKSVM